MLGWAWTEIWCWISCRPASEPRCRKMLLENVAEKQMLRVSGRYAKSRGPWPNPERHCHRKWQWYHPGTTDVKPHENSHHLNWLCCSHPHLSKHLCFWPLATAILGFACRACTTSVATLPSDISPEHGFSAVQMSALECILLVSFDFLRPCHISAFVQKPHRVVTWKQHQKSPKMMCSQKNWCNPISAVCQRKHVGRSPLPGTGYSPSCKMSRNVKHFKRASDPKWSVKVCHDQFLKAHSVSMYWTGPHKKGNTKHSRWRLDSDIKPHARDFRPAMSAKCVEKILNCITLKHSMNFHNQSLIPQKSQSSQNLSLLYLQNQRGRHWWSD